MPPLERSWSPRQAIRPTPVASTRPKKPNRSGPIEEAVKEWTDWNTPERVKKVPRMVRLNVAITNERFQIRSSPRRCWTITECR